MERTGESVPAPSTLVLGDIARASGPFLSTYMTTEAEVENAGASGVRRWKSLRRALVDAGAPDDRLAVVDEQVGDAHLEGQALGVVTSASGARVVDYDGEPLATDICRWGDVPVLTPALAWRQHEPPYVAVLADRRGADLVAVSHVRPPAIVSAGEDRWPIAKASGGGRAHWRFEHRVEENWARNERAVASELERLVELVDAHLVVVAGDEHAIGLLRAALPARVAHLMETVPGSRATESARDGLGDAAARWVRSVAARETAETLETLHGRAADGRAVQGAEATLRALRASRVDVLVVHDARLTPTPSPGGRDDGDERLAWFDRARPATCALTPDDLHAVGRGDLGYGSVIDVAVRGALATGAGVRLLPAHGGPLDGIGGFVRWRE